MSAETPVATLQSWAKAQQLSTVTLNAEGTELSKDGLTLVANEKYTVQHNDKNCEYTLASIYLQILDPNQGLVKYRSACKKHAVKDPVKASDKATIVDFFLGSQQPSDTTAVAAVAPPIQEKPAAAATAATPTLPPAAAAPAPDAAARPPSSSSSRDKHRSSKERHRSSSRDKHRHDKKRSHSSSREEKKKKAPKTIDTEKLFSNLITVVDKRAAKEKKEANAQLVAALSTEGFGVTPELLEENREASQAIASNEIPVGNSASILKAAAGKSLKRILDIYMEVVNTPKGKSSASSSSGAASSSKKARPHLVGKKPIIIVPKGMTAPITLLNAHEFFGKSNFVPRDAMLKKGVNKNAIPTTFQRKVGPRLGGGTVEYEIMDNPKSKLPTAKDWDRVVAVVCLGQSWQFKDWPSHYKDPVRLFGSVFGFYAGMQGAKIPADLASWAVTKSMLNRDKRGLDSVTYASFWNGLDEFMAIHKPEMLPQPDA